MAQGKVNTLHYADAGHQRRRHLPRRLALAMVVLGAVAVLMAWLPRFVHGLRLVSLQKECMDYSAPANQVVFDGRTSAALLFQPSDPELSISKGLNGWSFLCRTPAARTSFLTFIKSSDLGSSGTLFLHRLKNSLGGERLVLVDLSYMPLSGGAPSEAVRARLFYPGTVSSPTYEVLQPFPKNWLSVPLRETVFYAGQVDPKNGSHFTVRATIKGSACVLEGYLGDDESISLELVPATSAGSSSN